jgi:hypothetical protein
MKFTLVLPLALATLGLAAPAPAEVEKRFVGQLTLFKAANYNGQSISLNVDTTVNGGCGRTPRLRILGKANDFSSCSVGIQ